MVNMILAGFEMTTAMLLFHRAIPSVIQAGKLKAFKIWALALCIGLFSVDRFTAFLNVSQVTPMTLLAHVWLISYGLLRYVHIARRGLTAWGDTFDV